MSYESNTNLSHGVVAIKPEPGALGTDVNQQNSHGNGVHNSGRCLQSQDSGENRSSIVQSTGQSSSSSAVEQVQSPVDDLGVTSELVICPAPICRQFWKAGKYDDGFGPEARAHHSDGKNYLHVHPMFLHSNATSHKWAFGAIAELLDNAVDEIQNGATFVIVDKTKNPRDGMAALLIHDDGGGMDPQAIRHCMGFGFSEKKSESAIGRYGNGFKTSTMRLGADVIVFSRHLKNETWTQSIGLLSYTYLTRTGHDRIVVPILDYEFNKTTGRFEVLQDMDHFVPNLDILLEWSPFSTEAELLKQFDSIGPHGTMIIIYNLWFNNDAKLELDFDSDAEDILIDGNLKKAQTANEQHIANRFSYSLRVYLSILYLRLPENFTVVLRGKVVEHHNIADDLKYLQYILYKPQTGGCAKGTVVTTIGFLKDAPRVNIHGFCVYHKNRLIMPFWRVINCSNSRGRGVIGVLEANFIEPTHNKQDFEKTSLLQKLENRLKEMTWEYWDYHCMLIGYQAKPHIRKSQDIPSDSGMNSSTHLNKTSVGVGGTQTITAPPGFHQSFTKGNSTSLSRATVEPVLLAKRKQVPDLVESAVTKRQAGNTVQSVSRQSPTEQSGHTSAMQSKDPGTVGLMEENKKLRAKCLEHMKRSEKLELKASKLRSEIGKTNREYERLMTEFRALDVVKEEHRNERT
ncbi:PREDICTED: protein MICRORCHIDIA 6-like isoform X2 [Tarenaya hassleriana]|nr:PREDICTED: protein MICRORCHIDIA 6-like isoform X2 [Tarenaya hassleriana]XP_010533443.1 PREDICTED: protein MICRORCHIDIA 6-like isoform X2 [Tarenaya hassleriana]